MILTGTTPRRPSLARPLCLCLALAPGSADAEESALAHGSGAEPVLAPPSAAEGEPPLLKIMPLGASNTYGMYEDPTSAGGYRGPLFELLQAQGVRFDFVGLDRDGAIPDANHNGYPGKPIDWFTKPVNEAMDEERITYTIHSGQQSAVEHFIEQARMTENDVILLLVGTNSLLRGDSAEVMLADTEILLDQIVGSSASPCVHLMELTSIGGDYWEDGDPSRTNNDTIRLFNEGLEQMVATTYADLGVTLVTLEITASDRSPDGVHLNETGYRKVAEAWHDSLMRDGHVGDRVMDGPSPELAASP